MFGSTSVSYLSGLSIFGQTCGCQVVGVQGRSFPERQLDAAGEVTQIRQLRNDLPKITCQRHLHLCASWSPRHAFCTVASADTDQSLPAS